MPKTTTKKAAAPAAASSGPVSAADLLARIKPQLREESTQLILRPDLVDEWETATAALSEQQVKDSTNTRLASGVSAAQKELAKRVKELEEQIDDHGIWFRFRAMPKDRWQALCDRHPPRGDDQLDRFAGYNRDAVVDAAIRECLYDPVFDEDSWAEFLSVCNPSEWEELRQTVTSVNRGVFEAPKSALASRILTKRGSA